MMTRILQSGWVRAGDLVEVVEPVKLLSNEWHAPYDLERDRREHAK